MAIRSVSESYRLSLPWAIGTARKRERAGPTQTVAARSWAQAAREAILIVLAVALGRGVLAGTLYAFGPAYAIGAARSGGRQRTTAIALAVTLGLATVLPFSQIAPYGLAVCAAAWLTWRFGSAFGIAGYALVRSVAVVLTDGSANALLPVGAECAVVAALAGLYVVALRTAFRPASTRPLSMSEMVAAAVAACSLCASLTGVHVFSATAAGVLCRLAVLFAAAAGGPAPAAAVGAALGVSWTAGLQHVTATYALAGLLAGAFRSRGRLGIAGGAAAAALMGAADLATSRLVVGAIAETGLAIAVFACVPQDWVRGLARLIPGTAECNVRETLRERRLRDLVAKRLVDFARIFGELGRTFSDGAPAAPPSVGAETFPGFLEDIVRRSCAQCMGYETCWKENLYKSYLLMLDLLTLTEERGGKVQLADVPDAVRNRCVQPQQLVTAVNAAVEVFAAETAWERRLHESREIVAAQLSGVSQVMGGLAREMRTDAASTTGSADHEEALREELWRRSVVFDDVAVTDRGGGRLDVTVELPACTGECTCANCVAPALSRSLGVDLAVWNAKCHMKSPGSHCTFELVPRKRFDIVTDVLKVTKAGAVVSGDSYAILDLPGGKAGLVLSDGMGTGSRAALESNATIAMLSELLDAGLDREFAVRTINSILMLRSSDECFATIDMLVVDLHSGQSEFLKVGSAPSFIVRGTEATAVVCRSLPVGIVGSIDIKPSTVALKAGDLVVMITDGAVDAVNRVDKEAWLSKALEGMKTTNPKEVTARLYAMLSKDGSRKPADDITILAAKIVASGQHTDDGDGIQTLDTGHYAWERGAVRRLGAGIARK